MLSWIYMEFIKRFFSYLVVLELTTIGFVLEFWSGVVGILGSEQLFYTAHLGGMLLLGCAIGIIYCLHELKNIGYAVRFALYSMVGQLVWLGIFMFVAIT